MTVSLIKLWSVYGDPFGDSLSLISATYLPSITSIKSTHGLKHLKGLLVNPAFGFGK